MLTFPFKYLKLTSRLLHVFDSNNQEHFQLKEKIKWILHKIYVSYLQNTLHQRCKHLVKMSTFWFSALDSSEYIKWVFYILVFNLNKWIKIWQEYITFTTSFSIRYRRERQSISSPEKILNLGGKRIRSGQHNSELICSTQFTSCTSSSVYCVFSPSLNNIHFLSRQFI